MGVKESPMETDDTNSSWISATTKASSWPIVRGSIDHAVTCESSISGVESESDCDHAVGLGRQSPLLMRRPSLHSGPCEITIDFAQRHEIKQVYVRSTARVYEVYYASDERRGNEYLCTVRCSVAAKNEELMKVTDAIGSFSTSSSGSSRCVDEGHFRTQSGSCTKEDGWVVLKGPDSSALDGGDSSLLKENEGFTEQGIQDLFEATAEISDADAVLSVTLRFLSIQSGDYIHIDEVYVFADPVVSTDTDSLPKLPDNSSGNSLMSMLVPTLLHFSKSRMSQMQECHDPVAEKMKHQIPVNKSTGAVTTSSASEGAQSTMLTGASICMSNPEVCSQPPNPESSPSPTSREISCSHVERSLDELVSRVAKVEHFCLRLEENLLKPISSMEARLVKIEELLESFVKNPQFAGASGNRISAPEFSCNESESNSVCTDGKDSPLTMQLESIKLDVCSLEELQIPPSDVSSSVCGFQSSDVPSSTSVSQALPSLVITAPDFSNVDDEEGNDGSDASEESPNSNDRLKKPLSIDDALASALADFLSSASTDPLNGTVNVEGAADFPCVAERRSTSTSALTQSDEPVLTPFHVNKGNETTSISCKDLTVAAQDSLASGDNCTETVEIVDEQDHNVEEESSNKHVDSFVDNIINLEKDEAQESDMIAEVGPREADDCPNYYSDSSTLVGGAPSNDSVATLEAPGGNIDSRVEPDVLQNIFKLSTPAIVDFEIPILDVKFLSQNHSSASAPLEALLSNVSEHQTEVLCIKENNERSFTEQNDLVMLESKESASSEIYNNQFMSANCDSGYVPPITEDQELQESLI